MLFLGSLLICLLFQEAIAVTAQCNYVADSGQACVQSVVSTKFGFNVVSKTCEPFTYNGCGGNSNRFDTLSECIQTCNAMKTPSNGTTSYLGRYRRSENATQINWFNPFHPGPVILQTTTPVPSTETLNAKACNAAFAVQLTRPLQTCNAETACPEGYTCSDSAVCCPTKETVCSSDYDSGHEVSAFDHVGRYAFTASINSCNRFSYFGADGNFNNFKSYCDCMQYCRQN
uniref:Kunitz/Bovine pancreatic trypsin inhibitor domain protein n=1 Tax=Panagrellus redivivus TaxID=6233 RepID=A0A7E4ZQJ5_PANRE